MSKILIDKNHPPQIAVCDFNYLMVSEMFCDALQGEGVTTGHPAIFLRLTGCHLKCRWCDSTKIWSDGQKVSFAELNNLLYQNSNEFQLLNEGRIHLVITGGAPLLQQEKLASFLENLFSQGGSCFVEIENEGTIRPNEMLQQLVCLWTCSPKLNNSGVDKDKRYKPKVIRALSCLETQFKFVIRGEEDWLEIQKDYLDNQLIFPHQIVLMPEGCSREELDKSRLAVAEIAMRESVKYCDRLHIVLYDQKTGV